MGMRSRLQRLSIAAFLVAGVAFADEPATIATPTSEGGVTQVTERKTAAYRDVLAGFDAAILAAPDDAALAVARCKFISEFTDDEYGEWVEAAPADLEACGQALSVRWPKAPVAQLFALEQSWGDDAIKLGEKLFKESSEWPAPMRRELLTKLSESLEDKNADRSGELAVMAARLGEPSRAALAVDHLVARNDFTAAAALLRDTPPATVTWQAKARIESALALPDRHAAVAELRRYAKAGFEVEAAIAARAHLRAGDVAVARKLLKGADGKGSALQQVRFEAALAAKDFDAAAASVDVTDAENVAANLGRFAILLTQAPQTLWSGPMLLAALVCAVLVLLFALIPGLLCVPVHYRGLVRQVRGKAVVPLYDGIGLRHAWIAGALFLTVPLLVVAAIEPASLATLLGGEALPQADALFRATLWGTVVGLLCLVPLVRRMDLRQLVGDRTTIRQSWRVLLAWACLVGVGALVGVMNSQSGGSTETMQTKMVDALASGGRDTYGPWLALLVVALLVPIFEELVFRGLILGGLTRHISFGWANTLQAVLFASVHDDLPRFPFYLTLGLLAGWLVKKTRALGPAIALHVANNALAFSLRMLA